MINWLQFFTIILWISILLFLINFNNFIKLLFFSELVWIVLYCYTLYTGIINDDINLLSTSIFIIGFAGLEYSIGILLVIVFKNINKTLELSENSFEKFNYNIFNKKNLYINRYIFK